MEENKKSLSREDRYKHMNTKRWVAVGLALLLLVLSAIGSGIGSKLKKDSDDQAKKFMNKLVASEQGYTESVLQGTDASNRLLLVPIKGVIGPSNGNAFLASADYNQEKILATLDQAKKDKNLKGIVLEIDSPGGAVFQAAQVYDKVMEVKKETKLPVIAVMDSMAASGGYYIACAADKIYASNETITGSIGVIMSSLNLSGLLEKYGIQDTTIKSAAHKDIGSQTRTMTDEEREILQNYINSAYNRFLDVVAKGRKKTKEEIRPLADGRIFDGVQAKNVGLIDEIAYLDQALTAFEKDLGHKDMEVYTLDAPFSFNKLGFPFGATSKSRQKDPVTEEIQNRLSAPKAYYIYGGER